MSRSPAAVLSIAGSDPSGGAGIQADLKTFSALGVYGMAAVTALTVQDTTGVHAVHLVDAELVEAQVRAVMEDLAPDAVKIGMVGGPTQVMAIRRALEGFGGHVVLDPVLQSSSGVILGPLRAVRNLLGLASVITPNRMEAEALLDGRSPSDWAVLSGTAVLLTGGHGTDPDVVVDELWMPDGNQAAWRNTRMQSRNTHGTGCTLSAALAAQLAGGAVMVQACAKAVQYTQQRIAASVGHGLGVGTGPLLHTGEGSDGG